MKQTLTYTNHRICAAIAFILVVRISASVAAQGTLRSDIFPQQYASSEAPGSMAPFATGGVRYMMVYSGGLFGSAIADGALITQIAFRIDGPNGGQFGGGNTVSASLPDIEIHMSTSQAGSILSQPPLDQFGTRNFAPNVGADDTVVFQRGSLNWQSSWSSTGPNPFALKIPLSRSFQYNPAAGSLVIDMYVYSRSTDGLMLDTAAGGGADALAGPIGSSQGRGPQGAAMIELTYFPVPEPGMCSMLFLGTLVIVAYRKAFRS
jgi:hypothetical protein